MGLVTADDSVNACVMAAQAMCDYAAIWEPETGEISTVMGNGSGGPFALAEGGNRWRDAAGKLQSAQQRLTQGVQALPRGHWNGADRDAFDTEMSQLEAQLGDAHNYAMAVGITLDALAAPIGLWPVVCAGVGITEMAFASEFYATAAIPGVGEASFAAGEAATAICATIMNVSMVVMISVMAAATAAIAVSDVADISAQSKNGDSGVGAEFGKAAVDSAGEAALNVAVDRLNHRKEGGEEGTPGKHAGEPGPEPAPGTRTAPRHLKPPEWSETYGERRTRWAKEKGVEKGGDIVAPNLSALINYGMGKADDGWNAPDAPSPDDEGWGKSDDDLPEHHKHHHR